MRPGKKQSRKCKGEAAAPQSVTLRRKSRPQAAPSFPRLPPHGGGWQRGGVAEPQGQALRRPVRLPCPALSLTGGHTVPLQTGNQLPWAAPAPGGVWARGQWLGPRHNRVSPQSRVWSKGAGTWPAAAQADAGPATWCHSPGDLSGPVWGGGRGPSFWPATQHALASPAPSLQSQMGTTALSFQVLGRPPAL